ncbi:hypothetical protein NESM_000650500 [Novymonas esmeraldas]|uniref:Membrane-associated protein n=1 Tax=Novymonas esmeraldas TaxID=1808958 RepID=A0AAW0ETP3_9TRYP
MVPATAGAADMFRGPSPASCVHTLSFISSVAGAGSCDLPHSLLLSLHDGGDADRFHVWLANMLVSACVLLIVLLRIWWTCGDLPPSDVKSEPALGRVVPPPPTTTTTTTTTNITAGNDEESEVDVRALVAAAVRSTSLPQRCSVVPSISSIPRACYVRLLRGLADEEPPCDSPAALDGGGEGVRDGGGDNGVAPTASWLVERWRSLRCGLEPVRRAVTLWVRAVCHRSGTAYSLARMPFSSLVHVHHRQKAAAVCKRWQRWVYSSVQRRHSDDEASDEEFERTQDELWGILEAIERRRCARTGQHLYRDPLPSRSHHIHRRRFSVDAIAWADRQLGTIGVPPVVAAGLSLCFSADRTARPLLVDRRGRWIPVAVTDERGEYYDHRADCVLPHP